jgi:hypothetical protein
VALPDESEPRRSSSGFLLDYYGSAHHHRPVPLPRHWPGPERRSAASKNPALPCWTRYAVRYVVQYDFTVYFYYIYIFIIK